MNDVGKVRTCYNLRKVANFHSAPVVTSRNWVAIANLMCLAMEEADVRALESGNFRYALEPAQKKAVINIREARKGDKDAFYSPDVVD